MSDSEQAATAVISSAVAERLKGLGEAASTAVEELRRELERTPRIGLRREGPPTRHGGLVYKTWLEPRVGMPGLTVAYVYVPYPRPPVAVIVAVVPDGPPGPA